MKNIILHYEKSFKVCATDFAAGIFASHLMPQRDSNPCQ